MSIHKARITNQCLATSVAALFAVFSLTSGCKPGAAATAEQPTPKVTTTLVVSEEIVDSDEYTGRTEASEIVEIRARVFGYLKSIEFKDGDFVDEDQTLFTIEEDEYDAVYKQAESKIELHTAKNDLAKANLARKEKLLPTGAVSREEYDEGVAAVNESAAMIKAAEADRNRTAVDLKYTVVKAPIKGRIDRAMVSKGNLLTGGMSSGTMLTKIVNEQPMYVYFDVDERSLLRYMRQRASTRESAPGSLRELSIPCYLQLADETEFSHEGKLDFAASELSTSTGTARIRGIFTNEDRSLASGLFVRVRIPVSEPYDAVMIPERSIATDQSVKYVYVVGSDNTANRRTVKLGNQKGEMRIITDGLKDGEQIIVKGLQRVKPGQKVEASLATSEKPESSKQSAAKSRK